MNVSAWDWSFFAQASSFASACNDRNKSFARESGASSCGCMGANLNIQHVWDAAIKHMICAAANDVHWSYYGYYDYFVNPATLRWRATSALRRADVAIRRAGIL